MDSTGLSAKQHTGAWSEWTGRPSSLELAELSAAIEDALLFHERTLEKFGYGTPTRTWTEEDYIDVRTY